MVRPITDEDRERMFQFAKAVVFPHWNIKTEYDFKKEVTNIYFDVLDRDEERNEHVHGLVTPLIIHDGLMSTQLFLQPWLLIDRWPRIRTLIIHELAHVLQKERYAEQYGVLNAWQAQITGSRIVISETSEENKERIKRGDVPEEGIPLDFREIHIKGGVHGNAFREALRDMKEHAGNIKI